MPNRAGIPAIPQPLVGLMPRGLLHAPVPRLFLPAHKRRATCLTSMSTRARRHELRTIADDAESRHLLRFPAAAFHAQAGSTRLIENL